MPLTLVLVIALTQGSLAPDSGEVHLRNLRQLTFGGQNAEAYFSASGRLLIYSAARARRAGRPDVYDGDGRGWAAPGVRRAGTHHVRLLLRSGSAHLLFEHRARRRGVPAASRLLPRLRLGPVRLRHLYRRRRRLRRAPPDGQPGL